MHFMLVTRQALDRCARRRRSITHRPLDRGMSTAEYAVGTVAACGFAGLLFKILTSEKVNSMITDIVQRALQLPF